MEKDFDQLKLDNQLCFPLYAASRLLTKCYQPLLKNFDITYPQYLVLLVLWTDNNLSLTAISEKLRLQSNTLTPLLKRMEKQGLLTRKRSKNDERSIVISLTEKGEHLKTEAVYIPPTVFEALPLTREEVMELHYLLYKLIDNLEDK
ncbi:MarR family winged helix-turn-helix transcriptional regulator [Zhouia sp. PK063]|uniref:MarR family winged helix-turn-helix transcriptional regulator n=1 Tax=Zhouia sp. PK063 TaxID=3373602 RepID=UPI0037935245